MRLPSPRRLIQDKLTAALEAVPDGGKRDHLPRGSPRVGHAQPAVSQFRQAGY
jgi:hypothetical protein